VSIYTLPETFVASTRTLEKSCPSEYDPENRKSTTKSGTTDSFIRLVNIKILLLLFTDPKN